MKTRENIHQKLNNLFFSEFANNLAAPLIKKVSCFNKGDFNNRFDLRVATDENQLGNWWRHPIYIIAKPSAENVVINITIQPQRWPDDVENYANEHKNIIDQKYQEINDLIKSHSINASDVKQEIKTESKFVLSYSLSITIDKANPSEADYLKFINFLADLCLITVSLSDELPVGDDTSKLEEADISWQEQNPIQNEEINSNLSNNDKRVYLFCLSVSTDEDIQIVTEQIFEKVHLIKSFIKANIDDNVNAFLFEEFNQSYQLAKSLNKKSIDEADFKEYIMQLLQKYTQTDFNGYFEFEFNTSFIFDLTSKINEVGFIDVWNEKFLELSAEVDDNFTIFGYHEVYEDIIRQIYDHGEWETGLIASEQGYFDCPLSDYIRSEAGWDNPQESIFDLTTYNKVQVDQEISLSEETCEKTEVDSITVNSDSKEELPHKEIVIGKQIWSSKNLNLDKFRNGDSIIETKSNDEFAQACISGKPAWFYYGNDLANGEKYGKLYNWYAVSDPRGLAPEGWHIPSDEDWKSLIDYLGGTEVAGEKMKNTKEWGGTDSEITNESGFSGLPGGKCDDQESMEIGETGCWWSSTDSNETMAMNIELSDIFSSVSICESNKKYLGYSVRCLKD